MSTTDFYTYFEHVNESCSKNAEALPAGQQYEYKILKCDENESIDIPDGAYITGAYWGDPKQFKKGKDITKKVVAFVREKNFKTIFGNTEWFGDPWYGTRKTLQIRIAIKKSAPPPAPVAPVRATPAPVNATPAYPAAAAVTTAARPAYPAAAVVTTAARPAYPAAAVVTTAARPAYPAAAVVTTPARPAYPAAVAVTAPARPAYPAAVAVTAPARPAYPAATPAYPAATPAYPAATPAYPAATATVPAVAPPRPGLIYPNRAAVVAPAPVVHHVVHQQRVVVPQQRVVVTNRAAMGRQIYGNAMIGRPVMGGMRMRPAMVQQRTAFVANPNGGGRQMTLGMINQEIQQLKTRRMRQGRLFAFGQNRLRNLKMARRQLAGGRGGYHADAAW